MDEQKQSIAATLPEGTAEARVLKQVEAAARQYLVNHDRDESKILGISLTTIVKKGKKPARALQVEWRKLARQRPPTPAKRSYIEKLVVIYENATGKKLGRINVIEYVGEWMLIPKEKPHPFLVACLGAVHKPYSPRLVQEALHKRHK